MNSDIPTFSGKAMPGGSLQHEFPGQVRAWLTRIAGDAGQFVEYQIWPSALKKSRRQEKGFHAMVSPWAKERGWKLDALKQFLLKEVFGTHEFVNPRTGESVLVLAEPHTSALTRAQYSELIERTLDIAAEDDYYLTAPDEYRRAKEAAVRKHVRHLQRRDALASRGVVSR